MKEPQQARSRETQRRIIRAARSLTASVGFEAASVASIAEEAGLSVGAFYQRFENKEALLSALHEEVVQHNIGLMRRAFDPERWADRPAIEIIEDLVDGLLRVSERDIGFFRACYQRALTDAAFAAREARERQELAELVTPLLIGKVKGGTKAERAEAIHFCLITVTAVASDVDVASAFPVISGPVDREKLAARLVTICCDHLGIEKPHRRSTRG